MAERARAKPVNVKTHWVLFTITSADEDITFSTTLVLEPQRHLIFRALRPARRINSPMVREVVTKQLRQVF
jgi:hypothetical protein